MKPLTQIREDIEDEIATFLRGLDSRDIAFSVGGGVLSFLIFLVM